MSEPSMISKGSLNRNGARISEEEIDLCVSVL